MPPELEAEQRLWEAPPDLRAAAERSLEARLTELEAQVLSSDQVLQAALAEKSQLLTRSEDLQTKLQISSAKLLEAEQRALNEAAVLNQQAASQAAALQSECQSFAAHCRVVEQSEHQAMEALQAHLKAQAAEGESLREGLLSRLRLAESLAEAALQEAQTSTLEVSQAKQAELESRLHHAEAALHEAGTVNAELSSQAQERKSQCDLLQSQLHKIETDMHGAMIEAESAQSELATQAEHFAQERSELAALINQLRSSEQVAVLEAETAKDHAGVQAALAEEAASRCGSLELRLGSAEEAARRERDAVRSSTEVLEATVARHARSSREELTAHLECIKDAVVGLQGRCDIRDDRERLTAQLGAARSEVVEAQALLEVAEQRAQLDLRSAEMRCRESENTAAKALNDVEDLWRHTVRKQEAVAETLQSELDEQRVAHQQSLARASEAAAEAARRELRELQRAHQAQLAELLEAQWTCSKRVRR
eukprot:SRR837773.17587.p1 GENE.SRR837773.17587~~SRR837773.17587.p1  ORF type:complete len:482 (-),score=94.39 SRR837773.17587:121-1566(-)